MQLWVSEGVARRDMCNTYGLSYERMSAAFFERRHLCDSLVQAGFLPEGFLQREREGDWTMIDGFILAGNDIHVETMTVDEAKKKVGIFANCKGFCVRRPMPKDPAEAVEIYFKDECVNSFASDPWTSFKKEDPPPPDWTVVRAAVTGGLFPNVV